MSHEDYTTFPSTPPAPTPVSSTTTLTERRPPSPTLTEALRGLGQGGATRSQILRGPVTDGFAEPKSSTRRIGPNAGKRGLRYKDRSVVVQVSTDEGLDRLVRTVDRGDSQRRVQPKSLPPLTQGVPSRGIFSKTRGHYAYSDRAHMLPVARLPDRLSKASGMSDVSKEARMEQVEGGSGGVLGENRTTFANTGASGAAPLTKKQKILRHYKKWWWLHLLALIAIVILVVCLM